MTEENRERTREMIKVMQAYVDGGKVFDARGYECSAPAWQWLTEGTYSIAPYTTSDTINWDHVAPDFKWMARDDDDACYLYTEKPSKDDEFWYGDDISSRASSHSSYKRGTCDWKDSLVRRPG